MELHVLSDGFFELNCGFLVYGKADYYEKKYWASLNPLLIIDDEHRILCDSGIGSLPEKLRKWYNIKRPEGDLISNIEKKGLTPRDIDIIIQTHLHFDHFSQNITLFEKAIIIAQTEEIRYSFYPDRFQKGGYGPIKHLLSKVNFEPVNGHTNITDGVEVIPTPGHTPGHQSILCYTDEEIICFTGDATPLEENLNQRNIPGVLWNSWQALESIDFLRGIDADQYIFSHSNKEEFVK